MNYTFGVCGEAGDALAPVASFLVRRGENMRAVSIFVLLVSAGCGSAPLSEEIVRFSGSTVAAGEALARYPGGYNQDVRRAAFARAVVDPRLIPEEGPACTGADPDAPPGRPGDARLCFRSDILSSADVEFFQKATATVVAYTETLARLADADGLDKVRVQSKILAEALGGLNATLQDAEFLGEDEAFAATLGLLVRSLADLQAVKDRESALRTTLTDADPHFQDAARTLAALYTQLARVRASAISESYNKLETVYAQRAMANAHPSEDNRLAILGALERLSAAQTNDPTETIAGLFVAMAEVHSALTSAYQSGAAEAPAALTASLQKLSSLAAALVAASAAFAHPSVTP